MAHDRSYDVVVAGAGVVGASVAHHLARAGLSVAVIDTVGPAAAASGASDGAVSVASKKPGVMAQLATASLLYTAELAKPGGPLAEIFKPRPSFFFATGPDEDLALDALVAKLGSLGGPVQVVDDTRGNGGLAGLGAAVRRVVQITGEGHMLGYAAVRAYLDAHGITRIWPASVTGVEEVPGGVRVKTSQGELRAGHLVAALGVSTTKLFPAMPVVPRAGQLIVTDRATGARALPGVLTAASYLIAKTTEQGRLPTPPVVIDPLTTGQFLIGSSREDHDDPTRTDFQTVRRLLRRAVEIYPELAQRRVIRCFAGVRAAVTDGLPIVGALSGSRRIILATGFEGDGICLSALTGREVAAMVLGNPVIADIHAWSPNRFMQSLAVQR